MRGWRLQDELWRSCNVLIIEIGACGMVRLPTNWYVSIHHFLVAEWALLRINFRALLLRELTCRPASICFTVH